MTRERARALRRNATEEERLLWARLRGRRLMNWRFRRQVPLGPYIVDFACFERRFIIEVDGYHHDLPEHRVKDELRTAWLVAQGFRLHRVWNVDVRHNIEGVLASIVGEIENTGEN